MINDVIHFYDFIVTLIFVEELNLDSIFFCFKAGRIISFWPAVGHVNSTVFFLGLL